jgi:hypothetical protein
MADKDTLPFVVAEADELSVRGALPGVVSSVGVNFVDIASSAVEAGLIRIIRGMTDALEKASSQAGTYEISTVEIGVAVSAKGELAIVGSAKGGLDGSTTLKLTLAKKSQ